MDDDWGIKPPLNWKSIGPDPVAIVAKKFNVLPFTVRKEMAKLEKLKRIEVEQKISLRLKRTTHFLQIAHDREANEAVCSRCKRKGFDTWDEMQAHVRCHLMMENLDNEKFANTAQRVAADCDKLFYPATKLSRREKVSGFLPQDEDAEEIEARVAGRLGPGS